MGKRILTQWSKKFSHNDQKQILTQRLSKTNSHRWTGGTGERGSGTRVLNAKEGKHVFQLKFFFAQSLKHLLQQPNHRPQQARRTARKESKRTGEGWGRRCQREKCSFCRSKAGNAEKIRIGDCFWPHKLLYDPWEIDFENWSWIMI